MFLRTLFVACLSMTAAGQTGPAPAAPAAAGALSYELVSIHKSKPEARGYDMGKTPEGIEARAINLHQLLSEAYGFTLGELLEDQIVGLPDWGRTQRFDIKARVDDSDVQKLKASRDAETMEVWVRSMVDRKPTAETAMLQQLVREQFHLGMHYEQHTMQVYAMTVAKSGVRMAVAKTKDPEHGSLSASNGKMEGDNLPPDFLTFLLAREVGRPVVNRTNLPGRYDFRMTYTPGADLNTAAPTDTAPSIFTALEEQLGIKLIRAKEPVWVIVVDHAELPPEE